MFSIWDEKNFICEQEKNLAKVWENSSSSNTMQVLQ